MTGHWKSEFDKVARNGITNYAKLYGKDPSEIGILMLLDQHQNAQFHITVGKGNNPEIREPVKFLHILHKPTTKFDVTGKAFLIPKIIAKILVRLSERFGVDPVIFSVQVVLREGDIYLFPMHGTRIIKLLDEEEAFDDEQVAMDLMEEVK